MVRTSLSALVVFFLAPHCSSLAPNWSYNPLKLSSLSSTRQSSISLLSIKNSEADYTNFPEPLQDAAQFLDEATGGWALSYADCSPENESTAIGISFLATNIAYLAVGALLYTNGEQLLGVLAEIAGIVSYIYHYNQLASRGENSPAVRLSLFIDYFTAGSALLLGVFYLFQDFTTLVPSMTGGFGALLSLSPKLLAALGCSTAAITSLALCWVWEFGVPYLFWHSLWHLFSAGTAYFVGGLHADLFR